MCSMNKLPLDWMKSLFCLSWGQTLKEGRIPGLRNHLFECPLQDKGCWGWWTPHPRLRRSPQTVPLQRWPKQTQSHWDGWGRMGTVKYNCDLWLFLHNKNRKQEHEELRTGTVVTSRSRCHFQHCCPCRTLGRSVSTWWQEVPAWPHHSKARTKWTEMS